MYLLGRGRWNVHVTVEDWTTSRLEFKHDNLSKSMLLKRSIERTDDFDEDSWFCGKISNVLGEVRICNSTLGGCCEVSIFGCIVWNDLILLFVNDSRKASVIGDVWVSRTYKKKWNNQDMWQLN